MKIFIALERYRSAQSDAVLARGRRGSDRRRSKELVDRQRDLRWRRRLRARACAV
jgi:hypothetical protein